VLLEVGLILLITYTPWGNLLLGTAPLPLAVWLFLLPWALGMITLEELQVPGAPPSGDPEIVRTAMSAPAGAVLTAPL
jgi:hypothetical protein